MPSLRVLAAQKKSANHGAHASGLPQKSRNEFCGIISGLPQKSRSEFCGIISGLPQKSRSEFCGKRRCRRKRKQLEQTQAVSKCALRRQQDPAETPEGVPYFGFARAMPKASGVGASGFTCSLLMHLCFAASRFCSLLPDPDVRLHPTSGWRPRASRHRNASASRHSSHAAAARTDSR